MRVVDGLEAIDVELGQLQGPMIAGGARQLAVEEFHQIALVMDFREGVDDRQTIDLFVVFGLDVAAGEKAINAIADAQVIAIFELAHGRRCIVDKGAVGALQVDGIVAVGSREDAGVAAGYGMVLDLQVAVIVAADHQGGAGQRIARAHARSCGVNMYQASFAFGGRNGTRGRRHPGLGDSLYGAVRGDVLRQDSATTIVPLSG